MKKRGKTVLWLVFTLIIIGSCLLLHKYLSFSPFSTEYQFLGISMAVESSTGNTYLVDEGKKKLLILGKDGKLERYLEGGSLDADFFYAFHVCDDGNGRIYVSDVIYGEHGSRIDKERVLCFEGGKRKVIYEKDYDTETSDAPIAYGRILELTRQEDEVYFLEKGEGGIRRYVVQGTEVSLAETIPCWMDVASAAYDAWTGTYIVSTKQGTLYHCISGSRTWMDFQENGERMLPWSLSASNGKLYISDHINHQIREADLCDYGKNLSSHLVYEDGRHYAQLSATGSDELILTDNGGYQRLSAASGEKEEFLSVKISFFHWILVAWFCLGVLCILGILLLIRLGKYSFRRYMQREDKSSVLRTFTVVCASVVVASMVSYTSIQNIDEEIIGTAVENLCFVADALEENVDAEQVVRIGEDLDNYNSEEFQAMKRPLDLIMDASYENEIYYYYLLYTLDENGFNVVADYEDSYACGQLLYEYGDNILTEAYQTGERVVDADNISSYGSYICVVNPVFDSKGNVVAELEAGISADPFQEKKSALVWESICTVFASSAVVTMLILELLFAINFYDQRRKIPYEKQDSTQTIPLRLMVFMIYLTDGMQDAFIALQCERLYAQAAGEGWISMLPEGIAIALPISVQLLFAAIASLFGGWLITRTGTRKLMCSGAVIQAAGFAVCAIFGESYLAITLGKILVGAGQGFVYVSANTMAALTDNEENSQKTFADISAGILSGISVGAGLGATLLSIGNVQTVYYVAAIVMGIAAWIAFTAKNFQTASPQKEEKIKEEEKVGILRFLTDRQSFSFLLFLLTPFMIALSFRDYFFPLFAGGQGMSEVRIGQIYLLFGLLTIYVGPQLAEFLLKHLGARKSVILSSVLMAGSIGIYVLYPCMETVLAGIMAFYLVISFAYTCQYSYFETIPAVLKYGEGPAMGVYSMFESIGQTLGPILFGVALGAGNQKGMFMVMAGLLLLTVLFVVSSLTRRKQRVKKAGQ